MLIAGDEFGPLGGLPGSDSFLLVPEASRATAISVGAEPSGTPAAVISLGGGPELFVRVLADQLERRRRRDVPEPDGDPYWTLAVDGLDPRLERVHESLLTLADGRLGTRGAPLFDHPSLAPAVVLSGVYAGEGAYTTLAPCPDWTRLVHAPSKRPQVSRQLDLATGLLWEDGDVTSLRFSSLARPGTVVLRAHANPGRLRFGGGVRVGGRSRRSCATGVGDELSSASAHTTVIRSSRRRRWAMPPRWVSRGCFANTERLGQAGGRRPTSWSKVITSYRRPFVSLSSI